MAASYDINVNVNVLSDAQAVRRQGFGDVLYLDKATTFAVGMAKLFTSNSDAQADGELSANAKAAAAAFFSQTPNTGRFIVGEYAFALAGDLSDALDALRADATAGGFYGLAADTRTAAEVEEIAAWSAADGACLYAAQTSDADVLSGTPGNVALDLEAAANGRVFVTYHSDDAEEVALAWLAMTLAADPDQVTTIWSYKTLAGITPQDLTATEKQAVLDANANVYLTAGGVGATGPGKLSDGRFIDTLVSKDWYKARVQEAVLQLFLDMSNLNRKLPFDNTGIGAIEATLRGVQRRGELVGHFLADTSKVTAPDASEVSDADRVSRTLRLSSDITLSGAIETVTFNLAVLAA